MFDIEMRVRVRGVRKAEQDVFQVEKTCNYDQWAPREILCDRNYMEVNSWLAYARKHQAVVLLRYPAMVPFRFPLTDCRGKLQPCVDGLR